MSHKSCGVDELIVSGCGDCLCRVDLRRATGRFTGLQNLFPLHKNHTRLLDVGQRNFPEPSLVEIPAFDVRCCPKMPLSRSVMDSARNVTMGRLARAHDFPGRVLNKYGFGPSRRRLQLARAGLAPYKTAQLSVVGSVKESRVGVGRYTDAVLRCFTLAVTLLSPIAQSLPLPRYFRSSIAHCPRPRTAGKFGTTICSGYLKDRDAINKGVAVKCGRDSSSGLQSGSILVSKIRGARVPRIPRFELGRPAYQLFNLKIGHQTAFAFTPPNESYRSLKKYEVTRLSYRYFCLFNFHMHILMRSARSDWRVDASNKWCRDVKRSIFELSRDSLHPFHQAIVDSAMLPSRFNRSGE